VYAICKCVCLHKMEHVPLVYRIWQQDYTHFHTNRFKWFRNPPCKALYKLMGLFKHKTETGAAGAKSVLIPYIRLGVWDREGGGKIYLFKFCKSVHYCTIQINHQPDTTVFQFITLTFIYSSTCFGSSPAHHQEISDCGSCLWFYLRIVVIVLLLSWSGGSARPRTKQYYHHDTKIKPEAATAVIDLLMMGGRMPETCWAVNKRQDNKLENCCTWLVIYLNYTMIHGLTNLKFI
jgi:hypothetical protein